MNIEINSNTSSNTADNTTETADSNENNSATDLTTKYMKPIDFEPNPILKPELNFQPNYGTNFLSDTIETKPEPTAFQQKFNTNSMSESAKLIKSKNLKSGNKKSFVWKYFSHPKNVDGIEDKSRTECLECKSQLAFNASGTTTTMLNHLKSRHPKIAESEEWKKMRGSQIIGTTDSSIGQNNNNNNNGNNNNNNTRANESPTETLSPSISFELSKTNNPSPETKTPEVNLYSLYTNNTNHQNNSEGYLETARVMLLPSPFVVTTSCPTQSISGTNFLNNINMSLNTQETNNVNNSANINSNSQFSSNRSAVKRKRKKPMYIQNTNQLNLNGSQNYSQKQIKIECQKPNENSDLAPLQSISSLSQSSTAINSILCSSFLPNSLNTTIYNDNNNNASSPSFLEIKSPLYSGFSHPKSPLNYLCTKSNISDSDKIIVYWLIKDLRPYSILEETGIKALFSTLMPSVTIPSISHLKNHILPLIYSTLKTEILNDLASIGGAGFSIELWENDSNSSMYASIKLHYYSKTDSKLCCKMLKTKEIDAKHLCSDLLLSCCNEIGLDLSMNQFLPVVMNNPETMRDELDNVGEIEQNKKFIIIPCLMSSLQEVAKFGFEEPEVIKLLDKCRALKELSKAYNLGLENCTVNHTNPCKTSKYPSEKFELINWVHSNLDQILDRLDCYNTDRFNKEDELFLKQLTPLLEHIYQTLKVIEQNKLFFSASMIKSIILTMNKSPFQPKDDDHYGVIQFKMAVKKRLNKIYPTTGRLHEILWIATLLDPRFKKYHEQFTQDEIQMVQTIRNQIKNVNELTHEFSEECPSAIKREDLHTIFGDDCLSQEPKSEVDQYLSEHKIDIEKNPIKWWQDNSSRFPSLSKLAHKYLCIPLANHDSIESSGNESIVFNRRKELDPDEIDYYLFLNHNWN